MRLQWEILQWNQLPNTRCLPQMTPPAIKDFCTLKWPAKFRIPNPRTEKTTGVNFDRFSWPETCNLTNSPLPRQNNSLQPMGRNLLSWPMTQTFASNLVRREHIWHTTSRKEREAQTIRKQHPQSGSTDPHSVATIVLEHDLMHAKFEHVKSTAESTKSMLATCEAISALVSMQCCLLSSRNLVKRNRTSACLRHGHRDVIWMMKLGSSEHFSTCNIHTPDLCTNENFSKRNNFGGMLTARLLQHETRKRWRKVLKKSFLNVVFEVDFQNLLLLWCKPRRPIERSHSDADHVAGFSDEIADKERDTVMSTRRCWLSHGEAKQQPAYKAAD